MSSPHVIRLRGPWELQPLSRRPSGRDGALGLQTSDALPAGGRLKMPADWSALLGPGFRGRVRHVRCFNRPTGLEEGARVWLVCDGATGTAAVSLNGAPLGTVDGTNAVARFDITGRLIARNELVFDVESPVATQPASDASENCGGLTGEVRLEIFA